MTDSEKVSPKWNEELAKNINIYLENGRYPAKLPPMKRRNFRKRANDFVVKQGTQGSITKGEEDYHDWQFHLKRNNSKFLR